MDWSKVTQTIQEIGNSESSLRQNLKEIQPDLRYNNKQFINEGAMKRIYKCKDLSTGREVAYAMPKSSSTKEMESFLREAHITAALQHPNIIPVYDIGVKHETPYFVMKLIQGDSLADLLFDRSKRVPLNQLLNIFMKVCDAISYTHSRGIVHLDLKPDNIQISDHGEVLLCDWGLAKVIDWESCEQDNFLNDEAFYRADTLQTTLFGYIKGTPGFLSPEQAKGSKSKKSYASDIYSLGAILYSILTKRPPIKGENLEDIVQKTIKGKIRPPRSINKRASSSLEAICLKALQVKEYDRYNSVQDLIDDIELYLTGFAPKAEVVSIFKKGRLLIGRRPLLFASISSSITLIAIISLSASYLLQQKNRTLAVQKEEITAQKSEIEHHLQEAKNSKDKLEKAAVLAASEASQIAHGHLVNLNLTEAEEFYKRSLSLNPKNMMALQVKLELAVLNLEPSEVLKVMKRISQTPGKKPKSYLTLKKISHLRLSIDTPPHKALSFVKHFTPGSSMAKVALYKYLKFSQHSPEKMAIIPELLKHFNDYKPKNFSWSYKDGFYEIDLSKNPSLIQIHPLSGLPISKLSMTHSKAVQLGKLMCPDIKYLNLSYSKVSAWDSKNFKKLHLPNLETLILDHYTSRTPGLEGLRNTPIKTLSIRHTDLIDYRFLSSMPKLKKVIIDNYPEKFPRKILNKLSVEP